MNRFYFSDKGVTRKLNCPNLWPVPDKQFNRVPRHVFDTSGFVVHIEPKICHGLAMARIAVFDPARVRYRRHLGEQNVEVMFGGCIMNAEYYNSGQTVIRSIIQGDDDKSQEEIDHDWYSRELCIPILREAIELFVQYFPKQQL
jgi:hypothetical protein